VEVAELRIFLSSLGWVPDVPEGNRLRWLYPTMNTGKKGMYVGLPESILVERAPLHEDVKPQSYFSSASTMTVPSWWDDHGTVNLSGFLPLVHKFSSPVQAVSFTYRGPKTKLLALDSGSRMVAARQNVNDGDPICLQASAIDTLLFLTYPSVELQNFRTLDLFKDRGLQWETIAVIKVRDAFGAQYQEVVSRYGTSTSLTKEQWNDIVEQVWTAQHSSPNSLPKDDPSPWKTFELAVGIRWEYAVICGCGFFDGPHSVDSVLDSINVEKLLGNVPPHAYAYRVREPIRGGKHSNIVFCPGWVVSPLLPPSTPVYVDPQVKLHGNNTFEATYGLKWNQHDPLAIGVEFEEQISGSPSIPHSTPCNEVFENRGRSVGLSPFEEKIARSVEVPFFDVDLMCRCRAIDGWDRVSLPSAWAGPTSLVLIHQPPPPPLESAFHSSGQTKILRSVGDSVLPVWRPDVVVEKSLAKVFIYRRILGLNQRIQTVNVTSPALVEGDLYKTIMTTAVIAPNEFVGGYLVKGGFKTKIVDISGTEVFFRVPNVGGGTLILFGAGNVKLHQNPKHENLWTKVAEFPVNGLSTELDFSDSVPGPVDEADMLSYYARLSFSGQLGPPGNIVSAVRIPPVPAVSPPFTVELLGLDFYMRTMVKIHLTNPSGGLFTVWWADGAYDEDSFSSQAVPGEYKAQQAEDGLFLYDVLSLPIPNKTNRTVTIGVQRVNASGGQSNFCTVQIVLPAI
jgi:hypothetical protein